MVQNIEGYIAVAASGAMQDFYDESRLVGPGVTVLKEARAAVKDGTATQEQVELLDNKPVFEIRETDTEHDPRRHYACLDAILACCSDCVDRFIVNHLAAGDHPDDICEHLEIGKTQFYNRRNQIEARYDARHKKPEVAVSSIAAKADGQSVPHATTAAL